MIGSFAPATGGRLETTRRPSGGWVGIRANGWRRAMVLWIPLAKSSSCCFLLLNAHQRLLNGRGDAIRAFGTRMAIAREREIPIQIHEEKWHRGVFEQRICQRRFRPLLGRRSPVTWKHEQR